MTTFDTDVDAQLLQRARKAKVRAYAPYSGFHVGAALLTSDGDVFTGVNVENVSFGLTLCAERVAIGAMIATAGPRTLIDAIAVVGDGHDALMPCGACRQVLHEFGAMARVIASGDGGMPVVTSMVELLPRPFSALRLGQGRDGNDG
ncbi:MAG: cytidine deaminase [Nitriliruptoraceae bacterium]